MSVDSDIAATYRNASDHDRRKLDLMVNLRLREVTAPGRSVRETMAEISRNAQQRGLTLKFCDQSWKRNDLNGTRYQCHRQRQRFAFNDSAPGEH